MLSRGSAGKGGAIVPWQAQVDVNARVSDICRILPDAISFTEESKLVPKPTGYEHKKLSPRRPAFEARASPTSGPPSKPISDPQIPLTKRKLSRSSTDRQD